MKTGWCGRSPSARTFPHHLSAWENKVECKKAKENPRRGGWGAAAVLLHGWLALLFNGLFCLIYEEGGKKKKKRPPENRLIISSKNAELGLSCAQVALLN